MNKILATTFIVATLTLAGCGESEVTLTSIKVKDPKTQYTVGDSFVVPSVIATYSDNSTKDVKSETNFSGYNLNVAGDYTVTATYKDKFDQFTIKVVDSNLSSISVINPITSYTVGDDFIKPSVIATYNDGNTRDVKNEATFSGYNMSKAGSYTVNVSFGGKNDSYNITVSEEQTGDDISLATFNQKYKNNILTNHNYEASITASFDDDGEVISSQKLYNLNDSALFDNESGNEVFAGYVKQKGQGYVKFTMSQNGGGLLLGDFLSTNPNVGISELDPFCIESVLNTTFTKVSGRKQDFSCDSFYSISAIANLAFGDYVRYASAPESFLISVDDTNNNFVIRANFTYPTDDNVKAPVTVSIAVSNLGGVSNTSIENHVANPSYIYTAPTKWSDEDEALFDQYFGDFVPPFINGASYSFKVSSVLDTGFFVILAEDYASGDLSSSYGSALVGQGFSKVDDKYVLEVEDTTKYIKKTFTVTLKYVDPSSDTDIALYYPNGIFSAKYQYKEVTTLNVDTVSKLNDFLATSAAKKILPAFPLDGSIKVTGFKDGTDGANKLSDVGDFWAFVSPSRTDYFKVYIPTYNEAVAFINAYGALLGAKGFETQGMGHFLFSSWTDDYQSKFVFEDPLYAGESNYPGYVQIQLDVSLETVKNYVDPEEPVEYSISVANVTGGSITIETPANKLAKAGDGVVFSIDVNEGYTLQSAVVTCNGKSITVAGPDIMTGKYSFVMPEGNVVVGANITKDGGQEIPVVTSLTVVSPKVDYEVGDAFVAPTVKANYSNGTSEVVTTASFSGYDMSTAGTYTVTVSYMNVTANYTITVKDKGGDVPGEFGGDYKYVYNARNTYTLTFNDDGTGSYTRTQVTDEEGTKIFKLYFTYTLKDNKLTLTFTKFEGSTGFTDFQNGYCLFYSGHETNPTGSINSDGSVHMGLANRLTDAVTYYDFTK